MLSWIFFAHEVKCFVIEGQNSQWLKIDIDDIEFLEATNSFELFREGIVTKYFVIFIGFVFEIEAYSLVLCDLYFQCLVPS